MNQPVKAKTDSSSAATIKAAPSKRLTFAGWASLLLGGFFLIFSGSVGYYSWKTVEKNKLADSWAILFLEMEKSAPQISEFVNGTAATNAATFAFNENATELVNVEGLDPKTLKPADLGVNEFKEINTAIPHLFNINGVAHILQSHEAAQSEKTQTTVKQWTFQPIKSNQFSIPSSRIGDAAIIYIANKQGQLLYANNKQVTPANFAARPLEQKFINSALSRGQIEFTNETAQATFGFFYEVPKSNLVLFSEVEKKQALKQLEQLRRKLILLLLGSTLALVVLMQFPLRRISRSLQLLIGYIRSHLSGYSVDKLPALPSSEMMELATMVHHWAEKLDYTVKSERQSVVDHYHRNTLHSHGKYHDQVHAQMNKCDQPSPNLHLRVEQYTWQGRMSSGQICRGFLQRSSSGDYCLVQMKLYVADFAKPTLTAMVHAWLNSIDVFTALKPDMLIASLGNLIGLLTGAFGEQVALSWSVIFFDSGNNASVMQSSGFKTIIVDGKGAVKRLKGNSLGLMSAQTLNALSHQGLTAFTLQLKPAERLLCVDDTLLRTSAVFPKAFTFKKLTKALQISTNQSDFKAAFKLEINDHFHQDAPTDNYLCIIESVSGD